MVGPHVTGNPINAERSVTGIAVPSELFRKPALMVDVFPSVDGVELQIVAGDAVTFNWSHGLASNEPPPATSPPAWLHGAVEETPTGFVLQPHQLFSAFTLPGDSTK